MPFVRQLLKDWSLGDQTSMSLIPTLPLWAASLKLPQGRGQPMPLEHITSAVELGGGVGVGVGETFGPQPTLRPLGGCDQEASAHGSAARAASAGPGAVLYAAPARNSGSGSGSNRSSPA